MPPGTTASRDQAVPAPGAIPRRQLRHHVIFFAAYQIEGADGLVDAGTDDGLGLLAQSGQSGNRPSGNPGEVVEEDGLRLEVLASTDRRIDRIRISLTHPPTAA